MSQHSRPHAYVMGASVVTSRSIDVPVRGGLRLAFALPPQENPHEDRLCRLLDRLAQSRPGPLPQPT